MIVAIYPSLLSEKKLNVKLHKLCSLLLHINKKIQTFKFSRLYGFAFAKTI